MLKRRVGMAIEWYGNSGPYVRTYVRGAAVTAVAVFASDAAITPYLFRKIRIEDEATAARRGDSVLHPLIPKTKKRANLMDVVGSGASVGAFLGVKALSRGAL